MLLLQRDLQKAVRFYGEGIGLPVRVVTERWAELSAGPSTLALKAAYGCVEGGGGGVCSRHPMLLLETHGRSQRGSFHESAPQVLDTRQPACTITRLEHPHPTPLAPHFPHLLSPIRRMPPRPPTTPHPPSPPPPSHHLSNHRREAYCSTGYSPVLAFNVQDLQVWLRCFSFLSSVEQHCVVPALSSCSTGKPSFPGAHMMY